jgi:hypothetical protein
MKKSSSNPNWLQKGVAVILTLGLFAGITASTYMGQIEPEPMILDNTTVNTLTVNEEHMWQLNINDFLLDQLYSEAYNVAVLNIPDAKLSEFDIDVFPYSPSSKVRITYCFYSKLADRELDYVFNDKLKMNLERDISGNIVVNRVTFDSYPWITNEDWLLSIKKACEKIGPLTLDMHTGYLVWVVNSPKLTWHININDGVNWHWTLFRWDGQGDPVLVKKFGEDIKINHLVYYP